MIKESKLFDETKNIKTDNSFVQDDDIISRDASILVSGFGMRNLESFQKLIKMSHEERKKWQLRKLWRDQQVQQETLLKSREEILPGPSSARTETTETTTSYGIRTRTSSSDFLTQTETTTKTSTVRDDIKRLDYLLGVGEEMEEESEPRVDIKELEGFEDDFKYSSSKAIREAQRYLRAHRIFECFQLVVAHLLSANAENPIEFILNLFNRCLLYRSGLGEPPLLYERKHITKLFDLMDRLQTGFIDMPQYVTGMKTFGICTYNEHPEVNCDGLVSKEVFVEEAYEAELAIFNDLIKRRPEKNRRKEKKTPAAFDSVSVPSLNPPYFIPSDLFRFSKREANGVLDNILGE